MGDIILNTAKENDSGHVKSHLCQLLEHIKEKTLMFWNKVVNKILLMHSGRNHQTFTPKYTHTSSAHLHTRPVTNTYFTIRIFDQYSHHKTIQIIRIFESEAWPRAHKKDRLQTLPKSQVHVVTLLRQLTGTQLHSNAKSMQCTMI